MSTTPKTALEEKKTSSLFAGRKAALIALLLAAACAVAAAAVWWAEGAERPVIQGVKAELTAYEDDDIPALLLDGVTAVSGEDTQLQVAAAAYREAGEAVDVFRPGVYRVEYTCRKAEPVTAALTVLAADREPPAITGPRTLAVTVGETVSYRAGVTAVDNVDGPVSFQVDASQVNLAEPGQYPVVYSAVDSRGNRASVTATVVVSAAEAPAEDADAEAEGNEAAPGRTSSALDGVTTEDVYALGDRILSQITTAGMSQREKARAIFNYVSKKIRYVGTSDKSSWTLGAYVGLTQGRGDCFNYFAASKLLLTRAGIPNVDLSRVGGKTSHYWQLVNVGDGYYHFDTCPHPTGYSITAFLITEAEARAYTERCAPVRTNYYVYDYDACPVTVVGTPAETTPTPEAAPETTPETVPEVTPEAVPTPEATPAPEITPEAVPAPEAIPVTTPTPEAAPEAVPETAPEATPEPPASQPPGELLSPDEPLGPA